MRNLKIIALALVSLFILHGAAAAQDSPIDAVKANVEKILEAKRKAVSSITVADLKALMDKQEFFFEILDVRTEAEFKAGHIAGAVHSDRNKLEWVTPKKITDPKVPIYIYCKGGDRGTFAALRLMEMGYTKVTNVSGGIKAWADSGYPVYSDLGEFTFTEKGFGKKPE